MADKIPDSQMLPAGAHAEKKSVHKSDRKKESALDCIISHVFVIKIDNIKLLAVKIIKKARFMVIYYS